MWHSTPATAPVGRSARRGAQSTFESTRSASSRVCSAAVNEGAGVFVGTGVGVAVGAGVGVAGTGSGVADGDGDPVTGDADGEADGTAVTEGAGALEQPIATTAIATAMSMS